MTAALVAGSLLLPASPGFSASYSSTLTASDPSASHEVTVAAGTLRASLTFEPSLPVRTGPGMTASVRLTQPDGRSLAFRYGTSPVTLELPVAAGQYQLVVSTAWPLRQRDLDYDLDVTVSPTVSPTGTPTLTPTTVPTPQPSSTASASPTQRPTTTPSGPPATPTRWPTDIPTGAPTTVPPVTSSNAAAVCGTWVLYQVDDVAQLRALRPRIDAALALPGVTGFSVRFPWDAADLVGGHTSNDLLDEAYDISNKAGKALSIRFMAGAHTPERVFDAGAGYISVNGDRAPLPWDGATGKVQVFLDAYEAYARKLAAWSQTHGVRLLHLSWYGLDWSELNHGAEVRAADGYTEAKWLAGHKSLIDIGATLTSRTLAVELPLSGYGPLSNGESDELAAHIVDVAGPDSDRFFIQANGWDETRQWGAPDAAVESQFDRIWQRPLTRGVQMIQPDGYDWSRVFDQAEDADASYAEVYLPSFWQTPGPSAQLNHNTPERIGQLEREIAAFAKAAC